MSDPSEQTPLNPSSFESWADYYWTYQHRLTREGLIPMLSRHGVNIDGAQVLDVGCGDGGAACALAEAGAEVSGFDLSADLVQGAGQQSERRGVHLKLAQADITQHESLGEFAGPFDLICFRDVLEHIPDRRAALKNAVDRLASDGRILVVFPPYRSAYGGHQQILPLPKRFGLRWGKLPFAHLLPLSLYKTVAPMERTDPNWLEFLTIREARLTLGSMARVAEENGMVVEAETRYLLRPTFRLRYGLPVVPAGPLGKIPVLSEFLVMGSYVLLRHRS